MYKVPGMCLACCVATIGVMCVCFSEVEVSLLNQQIHDLGEALRAEKSESQKLTSALEQEKLQQISVSKNLKEVNRGSSKYFQYVYVHCAGRGSYRSVEGEATRN